MPTVLFCTQTQTAVGGLPTWLADLCERLPRLGWRPVVGLARGLRFHDPARYRAAFPALDTVELDGRTGSREGRLLAIRRAARRTRADVLVPVALADPYEAAARLKQAGSPVRLVAASHGACAPMLADVAQYGGCCDVAVGVSKLVAYLLREGAGLPAERVRYVPNGVQPPRRRRREAPAEAPLRLGYVGRLVPDKRAEDVAGLAELLAEDGTPYHLEVVGDGSQEAQLRRRLAPLVGRGVVAFHGALPLGELYDRIYPELDVLLLFSPSEGLPLAPIEAMSHGVVPVVSCFTGCLSEGLIRHGETGLIFGVGDLAEAARLVRGLADDRGLLRRLSAQGEAAVQERYVLDRSAAGWAEAFDLAVDLPPRNDVPARPPRPSGRLDALLSPAVAEFLRRLLRRRFVHPDAGEWPYAGNERPDLTARFETLAAEHEAQLRQPA